jgi:putative tryptophan/tyrosine transport system substrate-binding protein
MLQLPSHRETNRSTPGVRAPGRWSWLLVLALLMGWQTAAAEIVVVRSSDAAPYKDADAAVRDGLAGLKEPIRSVLVKDVADKGIDTLGGADGVIAIGTPAAHWLHDQLPAKIRLVYCMVNNPQDAGLLQGRPVWGVTTDVAVADQLSLISEALPQARTIGMLYRSDTEDGRAELKSLEGAVPHDWHVEAVAVNESPSVAEAIDSLTQKNVDVIWTTADQRVYDAASVRSLLLAGLRKKIPVWGFSTSFVRAGALLGVGVEPRAQGSQAAGILTKEIDDPKRIEFRAESPREFQIAVNLIVAQQLGIDVPDSLSRRAAFVFRPE